MSEPYSGVRVHRVKKELIDKLYKNKKIETWDNRYNWYENLYVVIKDETGSQSSALAKVSGQDLVLLKTDKSTKVSGLSPRNKEQCFALDSLLDDSVKVVALTGQAGTGKSVLALAAALSKVDQGVYDRIIISKNIVSVGKEIGFLPGSIDDKILPFNQGVLCSMEFLMGGNKDVVEDALKQYRIDFFPIAVVRGSSFHKSILIVDEVQNLSVHELLTIGTRVAEGSKIILLGDLNQIDIKTKKEFTGIHKFVNSSLTKASKLVSYVHLLKNERSEVAKLFSDVFGND